MTTTTETQPLLSVERVGQLLGVSRVTAYRLIARGALPHVRVGGRRLVEPEALQRFIDRARFEGAPASMNDAEPAGNRLEVTTTAADVGRADVFAES